MKNIMKFIHAVFAIYFTNFPYILYKDASNHGNIAFTRIGLEFIHSQQIFWGSTTIILFSIYLNNNLNYSLFLLCIFLYGISLVKIYDLRKFI